ncbi:MAG: hypothetical protein ACR2GE_02715 [Pseudonocardia sp.]
MLTALSAVVGQERDDGENFASGPRPADKLDNPDKLAGYLESIGLSAPEVTVVPFHISLDDPDSTWALVTGSALRFLLTGLPADAVARVRAGVLADLHGRAGAELAVPTLVGAATS